jgi:hypothetical protein
MRLKVEKSKHFLIIPGNPPIKHFYNEWIVELKSIFPESKFELLEYPLFENKNLKQDYLRSVSDHFEDIIKSRETSVTLIGHSIGGKFAFDLTQRLPHLIDKCILIFPFFGKPSIKGKLLLDISSVVDRRQLLSKLICNNITFLKQIIPETKFIVPRELQIGIRLARFEKESMRNELQEICFQSGRKDKVQFYYNIQDDWCTRETIEAFKDLVTSHRVEVKHDFVTCPADRKNLNHLLKTNLFFE